jgi:hypothetical protein
MTNQHRATPEQWARTEAMLGYADSSCLIELRNRIQLLEATQHAHIEAKASEAAPSPRPSSLVDRVADAMGAADDKGLTSMTRAAIREVAAYINERELENQNSPGYLEPSTAGDVFGWLRSAADR